MVRIFKSVFNKIPINQRLGIIEGQDQWRKNESCKELMIINRIIDNS